MIEFISDQQAMYVELERNLFNLYSRDPGEWAYTWQSATAGEVRADSEAHEFAEMQGRARAFSQYVASKRERMRGNMNAQNHKPYRAVFYTATASRYVDHRAELKKQGRELAEAIANEDVVSAKGVLDELQTHQAQAILDAHEFLQDALFVCERCGEVEWYDESRSVRTSAHRRTEEQWCESCCVNDAFICEDCGEWWSNDYLRENPSGNPVCDNCFDENYFVCDDCGGTFDNDRYGENGRCCDCYIDVEDEDEDAGDRDGLAEYHGSCRHFTPYNRDPNQPFKGAPPLGLEFEVYATEHRGDAVQDMKDFADNEFVGTVLFEKDSSLDSDQGFEIITDPLGYSEWQEHGPRLIKALQDSKIVGWDAKHGRYGIHLTVSRRDLSPLQEARMMMFLAAEDNRDFVRIMAQRENTYGSSSSESFPGLGQMAHSHQKISTLGGLRSSDKKIYGAGKYCPINFKENLAEFRLFASTTSLTSFMKNIEFVYALIEWTNPASATGSKWYHKDFLGWLKRRPLARKHYANLITYLERPKFYIKRHENPNETFFIGNHWRDYLPRMTLETTIAPSEASVTC